MPIFKIDVESKLSKDAKIIVACSTGGTMKPSMNLPEGIQSRYVLDNVYVIWINSSSLICYLNYNLPCWRWYITVRSTASSFLAEPLKLVGYARIELLFYFFLCLFF